MRITQHNGKLNQQEASKELFIKENDSPHISNINEVKITGKGIDISGNNSIIINDTSGIKLNDVFSVNASQIDISCTMNQLGILAMLFIQEVLKFILQTLVEMVV